MRKLKEKFMVMFGIPFYHSSRETCEKTLRGALRGSVFQTVCTPNAEQVILSKKLPDFLRLLQQADINLPDGFGIVWASRILFGVRGVVERISGREMVPFLLQECAKLRRPALVVGGREASARFADLMRVTVPGLEIFPDPGALDIQKEKHSERVRVLSMIRKIKPAVVLVGYGAPHQERWVMQNRSQMASAGVRVAMVVGGTFDMLSGSVAVAPTWVSKAGFEWLWRLVLEPWRWRRQFALPQFAILVLMEKVKQQLCTK